MEIPCDCFVSAQPESCECRQIKQADGRLVTRRLAGEGTRGGNTKLRHF